MRLLLFIRKVFTSRLALALLLINLILCIYALVSRPSEKIDLGAESWLFIILMLLNIPAIFGGGIILFTLLFLWTTFFAEIRATPNNSIFEMLQVVLFLLCVSFQWGLIGYGIERFLKRRKMNNGKLS